MEYVSGGQGDMASSSSAPARSTSLPTRSHPLCEIIEEELSKMKAWVASPHPTAEAMSVGIGGLVNLYESMEEVLCLPLAQQAIVRIRGEKCIEELLDGHVKLLDACTTLRDAIMAIKEHTQDVRSTIRRRGAHMTIARDVEAYIRSRKNVKKDVSKCLIALKIMEDRGSCHLNILDKDIDALMVVKVFRDVRTISVLAFRSLLSFVSMQKSTAKRSRWSLVSRAFILKGSAVSDETGEQMSELESVDASMLSLHNSLSNKDVKVDMVQLTQRRLGSLENCMVGLEAGAESIFRRLIQNRVSLLNNLSL